MGAKLKRSLSLPVLTLYGLGNILGAGIYVLVGKVAGEAGTSAPLAFIIAMIIAALTAFSYMELSSRFPVSASVSVYLHKAFKHRGLSVTVGLAIILSGITSAAALSQGFAGYFNAVINVNPALLSVGLLMAIGFLAIRGINESAWAAAFLTLAEIFGLLLVIWAGRGSINSDLAASFTHIDPSFGMAGILGGAFLAFYAFIGFEDMVNVSEEVKNPRKNMPRAILLALICATVLYLLVVVVSISLVSPSELATSDAPLALVFEKSGASNTFVITAIGVVAAVNGVVVQVIMGSRILYGLAREGWISKRFADIDRETKTPVFSTIVIVSLMIVGTVLLPLVSLAKLTSLLVLSIFALVNLALLRIKVTQKDQRGIVKIPAVIPFLGLVSCAAIVLYQFLSI